VEQRGGEKVNVPKASEKNSSSLPVIKCSCGAEILLIPNIKEMNKAIEAHIEQHIKKIKSAKEAEAEAERLRDELIIKVLEKASEM
jgi:hypothetical protein